MQYQNSVKRNPYTPTALATTSESAGWIWMVPEVESVVPPDL
jgi:hypothetical protein